MNNDEWRKLFWVGYYLSFLFCILFACMVTIPFELCIHSTVCKWINEQTKKHYMALYVWWKECGKVLRCVRVCCVGYIYFSFSSLIRWILDFSVWILSFRFFSVRTMSNISWMCARRVPFRIQIIVCEH